jgi:hypothetical protein
MIAFTDVMQRIRTTLQHQNKQEKIRDRDIAAALDLDPQYYAVIKRRNKIPYESIARFCQKHRISMNWILMDQKPPYLT